MDSRVQVALIEKAKRIFSQGANTFLSFPLLSPVTFKPDVLTAILAPQTPAHYAQAADFARVTNFIPKDIVAVPDTETTLWQVYDDILDSGQPALSQADPQAEERLKAAEAVLYETAADGTRSETEMYSEYRRLRDAWINAQENYAAQRTTGEYSTDEALRKEWVEVTEPNLRARIDEAKTDWESRGQRARVEAALTEIRSAAARAPSIRWSEWRARFNPDTDLRHLPETFAPTGFSPADVTTSSSWLHTALEADEIAALVAGAPPELHPVGGGDIERVEFDFRSVVITRPWFDVEALTSRIWRLPPDEEPLSDGADPPAGRLPAYVAAMVLVRNVVATMKAAEQGERTVPLLFTLRAQALTQRHLQLERSKFLRIRTESEIGGDVGAAPTGSDPAFLKLRRSSFKASDLRPVGPSLRRIRATPVERSASTVAVSGGASSWLRRLISVRGASAASTTVETAALPDPPPPVPEPQPDDTISVLAFICKRLPKTPDPLPQLIWS